jgi:nicotinate-nucleotide adenylyltransferase
MRIGLFGGTFDPIHLGHLDVAHAARRALGLDCVWMLPARLPPHREVPHASAAHRFAMVALAVIDQEGLLVSDLEMEARGPSYTMETLDRVDRTAAAKHERVLVTGADAFRDIRSWRGYPALLDRTHVAVVSRPGLPASAVRTLLPELGERMSEPSGSALGAPKIFLVDAPTAPVSSTQVRRALAGGERIQGLVPAAVARYIERQGLYRTDARTVDSKGPA